MTSWLHGPGSFPRDKINHAMEWMGWVTGPMVWIAMVIGLMVAGVRVAWSHRGEELRNIIPHVMRVALVAGGGSFFMGIMFTFSDGLVVWIIDAAGWKPEEAKDLFELGLASGGVLFLGLAIIGILMIIIVFIQWPMMILRTFAVPIILVYWPISEAMNMAAGQMRFSRAARWLVAFILYKPTVAILYAFAFTLLKEGTKEKDPLAILANLMMAESVLLLSVFALPAILKIVMPSAAAVGPSGGGDVLIEAVKVAAMTAVAAATAGAGSGAGAGVMAGNVTQNSGPGENFGEPGPTLEESGQTPPSGQKPKPEPKSEEESGSKKEQPDPKEDPTPPPEPEPKEDPEPKKEPEPKEQQQPILEEESKSAQKQPQLSGQFEGQKLVPSTAQHVQQPRRGSGQRLSQAANQFAHAVVDYSRNTPGPGEQILDEQYLDRDNQ